MHQTKTETGTKLEGLVSEAIYYYNIGRTEDQKAFLVKRQDGMRTRLKINLACIKLVT